MADQDSVLKILIPLLRFELCEQNECEVKKEDLTPEMLDALYKYSKRHDLAHMVGRALERLGFLDPNAEITKKFNNKQFVAIYRYEHMNYESTQIFRVLEESGIAYVPLKGAVIRDLYPEKWMRTSCDIDVLVHESDLRRATDALTSKLSYTEGERSYNEISLFSENGIHLELHFNILSNTGTLDKTLSQVWEFTTLDEGSKYRYSLTNEFFAFHLITHMLYHFVAGGCGIRAVGDLWLFKNKVSYDEKLLHRMCRECNADLFASAILRLADVWFSGEELDSLSEQMQRFILSGGSYGTLENKVSVQNVRKGGSLRYVMSRLFVPYETLKKRYPVLVKHKWLLIFCQIHRWFSLLRRGEMRRSVKELKKNSEISAERIDSTADFLKKLGLNQ